jgi:hypothetical protein
MCAVVRTAAQEARTDDEEPALSIGAIVGGITDVTRRWEDTTTALSQQVQAVRGSADSPLRLNVVFHIPGEIWGPDFVGIRTGRYSEKDRHLMVQVALPEGDYSTSVVENLLWSAVAEAENLGHRRKLFDGELVEVRRIATEAIRRMSETHG